jgi:hypothetical protein
VLDAVELIRGQERLAERRHAEIDERRLEHAAADPARRLDGTRRCCARMRVVSLCAMHLALLSLIPTV